jgi:hypothetical protein
MTEVSSTTFKSTTSTLYSDNSTGNIGADDLRTQMNNIADSASFKKTGMTQAPTVSDDGVSTAGTGVFKVGDFWIDESNDKAYVCIDNSATAAVWTEISFTNPAVLTASAAPSVNELAAWVDGTTLRGFEKLTWDDTDLTVDGNIVVTGTVDGRDLGTDGTKLDGLSTDAIDGVAMSIVNVDGTSSGFPATALVVVTGDGLSLSESATGVARIEIRNNDITANTTSRALAATDNGSHITNTGAVATVVWTLPITSALQSTPRLVTTFFKVADQTMHIIGASTVTVNGVTEAGGNESLIEICPTPYDSFAVVMYSGTSNTYYVYQSTDANDVSFNAQTGTAYTILMTDRNKTVTMNNASSNVLTIPANATTAFPIGSTLKVIQIGAGATTITGATGVVLNGVTAGSGALVGRWDEVTVSKVGTDAWYVTGDVGTVA